MDPDSEDREEIRGCGRPGPEGNKNLEETEAEVEADSERDMESEAEPELMEERMERSIGNSCSCTEDWSDSTELVLGYLKE